MNTATTALIDAAFEMSAATKNAYPKEGTPEFFTLTDVAHRLECACIAYKQALTPLLAHDKRSDGERRDGVALIANERIRQIADEQWSTTHDDSHSSGDMRDAAEAYLRELRYRFDHREGAVGKTPAAPWPWDDEAWKPTADPIRQLVKVGALIAAEIDRLQRAALAAQTEGKK